MVWVWVGACACVCISSHSFLSITLQDYIKLYLLHATHAETHAHRQKHTLAAEEEFVSCLLLQIFGEGLEVGLERSLRSRNRNHPQRKLRLGRCCRGCRRFGW